MKIRKMLALLLLLILMASCSKTSPVPDDSNFEDGVTYPQTDVSGINSTYIITDKGAVPLAYSNDGVVPLVDDIYYYNLENVISSDESVRLKTFTYFDSAGHNLGSVSFDDFEQNKTDNTPFATLATTGNWRLSPDMRTVYFEDASAPDEYISYIKDNFPDFFAETPVNITALWETDIDMDGTNEAVVKASGDGYAVISLMSQTLGNYVLMSDFSTDQGFVAQPFFADIDGNGKPSLIILSGGTLKTATVYQECALTPQYRLYLPM